MRQQVCILANVWGQAPGLSYGVPDIVTGLSKDTAPIGSSPRKIEIMF